MITEEKVRKLLEDSPTGITIESLAWFLQVYWGEVEKICERLEVEGIVRHRNNLYGESVYTLVK